MSFDVFSIEPAATKISFSSTNQNVSTSNVPDDATVTKWAFEYAARFGLDRGHLIPKKVLAKSNAGGGCGDALTNDICSRGIFLSRQLDGLGFFGNEIDGREGFSIEFGRGGQIRFFSLVWPNLEHSKNSPVASPEQIIACIKAQKIIVFPNDDETNYFERVRNLAKAKTFTITKITAYYIDGVLGETPPSNETPQIISPIAELEAVADYGNTNATVRLLSPIVSSEVSRLVGK